MQYLCHQQYLCVNVAHQFGVGPLAGEQGIVAVLINRNIDS